jgi:hypothetical protein
VQKRHGPADFSYLALMPKCPSQRGRSHSRP